MMPRRTLRQTAPKQGALRGEAPRCYFRATAAEWSHSIMTGVDRGQARSLGWHRVAESLELHHGACKGLWTGHEASVLVQLMRPSESSGTSGQ
jgi:hypothetical protein